MWAIEIINFIFASFNILYFWLNRIFIKWWQRPYLLNGFDVFFLDEETGAASNVILADVVLIVIGAKHAKLRILSVQILNLQRYLRVQFLIWKPLHWQSA